MNINMKWINYLTINLENHKVYYGYHKTEDPYLWDYYLGCGCYANKPSTYMSPTTPFQFAVKKYGPSKFRRILMGVFDTEKAALDREAEIVDYDWINRDDTYNVALGGQKGSGNYTVVYQFDSNGIFLRKWNSITEINETLGIDVGTLCKAIAWKRSCHQCFWAETDTINVNEYSIKVSQVIYQYTLEGKLVNTFKSIVDASKQTGVEPHFINHCAKGGYKCFGNYYAFKLYDTFCPPARLNLKNAEIYAYDLDGNFLKVFNGRQDVVDQLNLTQEACGLTEAIRCEKQYHGMQLRLTKYDKIDPVKIKYTGGKKVLCYTENGEFVEELPTVKAAREKYGECVAKVLKGQQKKTKGFIFKYSEED